MAAQGNYRPRYCNVQRQVVDIKPGENVLKYIQDFFETPAREHPVLRTPISTSSCDSSSDLSQNRFPSPSKKKKPPSSVLVNTVRSATCSETQQREACSSGDSVVLPNSPDEVEVSLASPALLIEEAPKDPEVAPQNQNGHLFACSNSRAMPPPLPRDTGSSESENEDEFLIAESFGGPSTSWLSRPQKNNLPKERCSTPRPLKSDKTSKKRSIDNTCCGDDVPVVEKGNSFSKQPQSIVPTALQSSSSKQAKKQKRPKNVPLKKQAQRPRKKIQSSARGVRRKRRGLVLEESVASEAKELCSKQAEVPPGDRLTLLGKRNAHVTQTLLVSPEDERDRALTQEGSCEMFPSTEEQNSRMLSEWCYFVRAINLNDLSGPVYKQNDKASLGHEIIRGNIGNSYSEPSAPPKEDSVVSPSDSLKDKAVGSPDNTASLRRSKRLRLKPLEYWRGERVMYKMKSSGGLVASGIISPKRKEPCKRNRIKQPTKIDLEKMTCNTNVALKDPSQLAHVFDAASKQEVLQKCVSSDHSHLLFFSNEDMSLYKYFSTPLFSTGKLILKPFKEKGSQYTATDTLVFYVVKGRLLFILYHQCYSLHAGNYFFVPEGNVYNLQNISKEECILVFTQIKGNRPESE